MESSTASAATSNGTQKRLSKPDAPPGTVSWDSAGDLVEEATGMASTKTRSFSLEACLTSDKYLKQSMPMVKAMAGRDFTIAYLQKEGFNNPLFFEDKADLDLKMPASKSFGVADVRGAVGSRRQVEVMDCNTQTNKTMTMKEWHKYFDTPKDQREGVHNVISLEFSSTRLDPQVQSPRVVRMIDWIDKAWPRHLKDMQLDGTNSLDEMMYPKVQKYCLMSVERCYTDFHIDLGGTSVWYHILQGKKVFFLIPPTDKNLKEYEEWQLSGKQADVFFGDKVEHCERFELAAGNTFFIPSGWIHAVYTVEDSIVFGGNFLHSFSIEKQLQVAHIEEVTRVPSKYRFPFFTELLWYVLDRYIHCLTGKSHLDLPEDEKRRIRLEKGENVDPNKEVLKLGGDGNGIVLPKDPDHLTQAELHGIKFIIMYLHHLPSSKKNVPLMLPDPIGVVKDVRDIVIKHKDDCPEQAITGKYILRWSENDDIRRSKAKQVIRGSALSPGISSQKHLGMKKSGFPTSRGGIASKVKGVSGNRRRRVRCKTCSACVGGDCRACVYCKDMAKYGGPGRMKQTCERRRCLQPQLPICAYCSVCKLDGWYAEPKALTGVKAEAERPDTPPKLFECTVCLDIVHPDCVEATDGLGKVNQELSNSWECAKCTKSGYPNAPSRASQATKRPAEPEGGISPEGEAKRAKLDE